MMNLETDDNSDSHNHKSSSDVANFTKVNHTNFLCIEYPGYIKDVDKMVSSMGGIENLSDTYFNNRCRLQMTYRPEDLNAHKVCADIVPCTGILMKVLRRKKCGTEKKDFEYKQEIVGFIRNQYKFQTLMDYQYLTPEPMWEYFNDIHGSELGRQKFPPYCAPPSFGRIDTCGAYNYRPDPASTKRVELAGKGINESFEHNPQETSATGRKRRQTESMAALFSSEEIPLEPSSNSKVIISNLMKGPDTETIETIRRLFDERPIWSKLALSCHLSNINLDRLKKIIQYFSYYWLSGPWRTMWCKFGYDPRKHPSAKVYQMIDFRVRDSKESKVNYADLVPKRSYKNYVPRNLQSRNIINSTSVLAASDEPGEKETDDLEPYIFKPTKMLPCRNMMYQLCDLHDLEVQKIIHENDEKESECNEKEGWFPVGTMNRIRIQLGKSVLAYFEAEKKKKIQGDNKNDEVNNINDTNTEDLQVIEPQPYDSEAQSFSYLQLLQDDNGYNMEEFNEYTEE